MKLSEKLRSAYQKNVYLNWYLIFDSTINFYIAAKFREQEIACKPESSYPTTHKLHVNFKRNNLSTTGKET